MSKVMLITGASRGIGAATAQLAAERGYALCLNYHHREDAARQVLHEVQRLGVQAIAVQADVSREDEVSTCSPRLIGNSAASTCWSTTPACWSDRCAWSKWTRHAGAACLAPM